MKEAAAFDGDYCLRDCRVAYFVLQSSGKNHQSVMPNFDNTQAVVR